MEQESASTLEASKSTKIKSLMLKVNTMMSLPLRCCATQQFA
jgi:hypothetical protein